MSISASVFDFAEYREKAENFEELWDSPARMSFFDLKFNSGFSRVDRHRSTAAIEESVFRRISR
jgi:hypothetical protein